MKNMRSRRFTVKKAETMLLFNALAELGYDRNLQISIPVVDSITMFKFNLEHTYVQVTEFMSESDYKKVTGSIGNLRAKQEIPDYQAIMQSFYQSGILELDGLEKLDQLFAGLRSENITKGGDVYYIALDTNLLWERFFTVYLEHIPLCSNLDFILCETVRDEMKNRDGKIGQKLLNSLSPLPSWLLKECFLNQNCLEDRRRYIGFFEYNRMRSITSCEEIDSPSDRSSMKNDQYILKAYSDFVDIGRKVIFISKDNEAVRMMAGEDNVIPVCLESNACPKADFTAGWNKFLDWLYILGILFGRIDLIVGGIPTASLYGVWSSKDVREWEEEQILLKIYKPESREEDEEKEYNLIIERLTKNLAILRDLAEL